MKNVGIGNWLLLFGAIVIGSTVGLRLSTGSDTIPGTSCCGGGATVNLPGPDTYWEGVDARAKGLPLPKGASEAYKRGYNGQ